MLTLTLRIGTLDLLLVTVGQIQKVVGRMNFRECFLLHAYISLIRGLVRLRLLLVEILRHANL